MIDIKLCITQLTLTNHPLYLFQIGYFHINDIDLIISISLSVMFLLVLIIFVFGNDFLWFFKFTNIRIFIPIVLLFIIILFLLHFAVTLLVTLPTRFWCEFVLLFI